MKLNLLDAISTVNNVILDSKILSTEKEIIEKFVEAAVTAMSADYGYCFEWNQNLKQFRLWYQDSKTPFISEVPRSDGVTARAFKNNQAFYIPHATKDPAVRDDAKQFMQGVVVIPIIYKTQQYGVLDVCFYKPHKFTGEEKILCQFIGNAAAQAITIHRLMKSEQEARKDAEQQKSRLQALIENSYDVVALLDKFGLINYISPSILRLSGYGAQELIGRKLSEFVDKQDLNLIRSHLKEILSQPDVAHTIEFRYVHKDGSWRWMEAVSANMLGNLSIGSVVSNARDITERKQASQTIQHQATHDPLTDLPNRKEISDRIDAAVKNAKQHKKLLAVMFLDMDRFKKINDTLGHAVGDDLLRTIAGRFKACLRTEDTVARFGGDEFIILLNDLSSSKDAVFIAEKLLKAAVLPVKIASQNFHPSVSVGIALYPHDGHDRESLKKHADIALYKAKQAGRNRYSLYDNSMQIYASEKFMLENELRQALEQKEIVLHYQPIVSLKNQTVTGVEALARWRHPTRGLLLPMEFIPLAEETGLASSLGDYIIKAACSDCKNWENLLLPNFRVAVNVSAHRFSEQDFTSRLAGFLREYKLDNKKLEIEITESTAMSDLGSTSRNLAELKRLGVSLSIDDFGTGYSSLSYLRTFPIQNLKIDKSFVQNCMVSDQDASIVKMIIAIGHNLNLRVIAEGVETKQQLEFLASLDCDAAQGFFIHPPMAADQLLHWLKTSQNKIKALV